MKFLSLIILFLSIIISCSNSLESPEDKFWKWFSENETYIYENAFSNKEQKKIFDKLSSLIQDVDQNLVFEFSPINKNGICEFSISADGIEDSFPAVEKLIAKSPKLKNWQFNAFRQRNIGDDIELQFDNYKLDYNDIYFRHSTEENKLGIELNIRDYDGSGDMQNAIYILLDNLLGEYDVTKNIEWIEWKKLNEDEVKNLSPFVNLREIVDSRKK